MTLRLVEGWNIITSSALAASRYAAVAGTFSFSSGRTASGKALRTDRHVADAATWTFNLADFDTYVLGCAIRWNGDLSAYEGGNQDFIGFWHNGTKQCHFAWLPPTSAQFFSGKFVNGNDQSFPFTVEFERNRWHYLEIKVVAGTGVNGYFEVRMNQTVVLSGNTNTAKNGSPLIDAVKFKGLVGGSGSADDGLLTDIYILDDQGSQHNDFLGNSAVEPVLLVGDDLVEFGRSGGVTNVSNVDEPIPDDDATYVFVQSTGNRDFYDVAPLQSLDSALFALVWSAHMRIAGSSGTRTVVPTFKIGSQEADGANIAVSQAAYGHYEQMFPNNPIDAQPWEIGDIANLKMGIQSVS